MTPGDVLAVDKRRYHRCAGIIWYLFTADGIRACRYHLRINMTPYASHIGDGT